MREDFRKRVSYGERNKKFFRKLYMRRISLTQTSLGQDKLTIKNSERKKRKRVVLKEGLV